MNFKLSIFLLLFAFVCGCNNLRAEHLVGGEIIYKCEGIDTINGIPMITLAFTAKMYRDCAGSGASFDSPANFVLFEGSGNDWDYVDVESSFVSSNPNIPLTNDPCIEPPPSVCLDEGIYLFEFQVPVSDESYMVVYQRCCRNNTIQNIINPGDVGVSFTVTISPLAQKICNNSPEFNDFPPAVICGNRPLTFDHSASDEDGHTLVYEFCAPLQGGGTAGIFGNPGNQFDCDGVTPNVSNCPPPYDNIIYKLPDFNAQIPLGAGADLKIEKNSGIITGQPTLLGQYVVGICVKEYLNGELLGTIQRDFQFNVTECVINVSAGIEDAEDLGDKTLKLDHCGNTPFTIINSSFDEEFIEGYLWNIFISQDSVKEFTSRDIEVQFDKPGFYTGNMILNPDATGCSDTLFLEINVFPDMEADFELEYDTCVAEPVKFKDNSFSETGVILEWSWEFDQNNKSNIQDPKHLFKEPGVKSVYLFSKDLNGCMDTITKTFDYYPAPPLIVVEPSAFSGCAPSEIKFNNLSAPIDSNYSILWDFGDGSMGNSVNEIHSYDEVGVYTVSLEIVSPLDCSIKREYPFWIEVLPEPIADFSFDPENPEGENVVIQFYNESEDAISWQYIIDSVNSVYQPNPTFQFDSVGLHSVDLIVKHPSGCPDTITKSFSILPKSSFYLPNAFSPNGDGVNDKFIGKGDFNSISNYYLQIYSRSGELIFTTEEITEGWNGKKNNKGIDLSPDVYVLKYGYKDARGNIINESGFITLVR